MAQLLKVQNFTVSADGYGAGQGQSLERLFGHADPGTLMSWGCPHRQLPRATTPGGSRGLDDHLARDFHHDIGAEIMGRNKSSPHRGPWADHAWQGWWGDQPPFHTPVFVLTHHPRPSFTLADTTFHFTDATPADALELGSGSRFWTSPHELDDRFHHDAAHPRPVGRPMKPEGVVWDDAGVTTTPTTTTAPSAPPHRR